MSDAIYHAFEQRQKDRGIDLKAVKATIKELKVETPSWGYGDSGTRFKVFKKAGVPRDAFEKFEDAAIVHKLTGTCPSVAIHIPWDKVKDYGKLRKHAESLGVKIGAVNPNVFQDDVYMLGSVCNADAKVRKQATDHMIECVEIMRACKSDVLSLWFADGTNYPGQANIRQRKHWMEEALAATYKHLDKNQRMLIEYKFFEPAFYHTDIADWGMAMSFAQKLGPQAEVLVDTGHHAPGTNVEHIVAFLLDEGKLGGFHFNARKYADDDLIVGSTNPYELFLIFHEILSAKENGAAKVKRTAENIAFMIDQSHCIEPKIPAMIRSVLNVQTQYAKALLVNWSELAEAQAKQDVLRAEAAVRDAFEQDVTSLLQVVREELGAAADPMKAYKDSGYGEKILSRGKGGASW
jgi:L-rhamnose isomerase/sugar isomerase